MLWGALPTALVLAVVLEAMFLVVDVGTGAYDVARSGEVMRVVVTFATVIALFSLVHLVFAERPRRLFVANVAAFVVFVAANVAQAASMGSFDYGFVSDHGKDVVTPLGRHILVDSLDALSLVLLFGCPLVVVVLLRLRRSPPWRLGRERNALSVLACTGFVAVVPIARIGTHEAITRFVASGIRFHVETQEAAAAVRATPFPYVHDAVPTPKGRAIAGADAPRPDVILVFLESVNGMFVDQKRADGTPYLPVWDAHMAEGLTFTHFYGSSVHSSRGHFATLCSLIPMFRGKELTDIPSTKLHCLPEVMNDAGYASIFYSASDEPDFEGSAAFFRRIGFGDVDFAVGLRGKDPMVWGVGVEDDVFYRRFFAMLDERAKDSTPIFAVAATASNHYPFKEDPKHAPDATQPTPFRKDYVASITQSDAWLAAFFEELEKRPRFRDAIVVLVGDHSFPADEHGIHFNLIGAYEESFRTAMLLRWRGHVVPERVQGRVASQIDLAPTIADLLQLRHRSHFTGRSLFAEGSPSPSPMVQPYDGVRLVAVKWPFKLMAHEAADQEHLYDLAKDPEERHDLAPEDVPAPALRELRDEIARIRTNQTLLKGGRIWP